MKQKKNMNNKIIIEIITYQTLIEIKATYDDITRSQQVQ